MPSLRVVAERSNLVAVVTQPDRPAGRGQKLTATPVKTAALAMRLRVVEPVALKPFADSLHAESFDLFVLASYGKILPQALLDIPRLGSLNVHPSLLPAYRGATPIQTALRNGERETGASIMLMDAGMDTGDIVVQERIPILPDDDYGSLHDRLAQQGAHLLARALDLAARGALLATPQSGESSSTRPISRDDLAVDLAWPAQRVVDAVRALSPQPGARAQIDGEPVKILRAHVGENDALVIDELIAPNRGRMTGETYARSRRARERA